MNKYFCLTLNKTGTRIKLFKFQVLDSCSSLLVYERSILILAILSAAFYLPTVIGSCVVACVPGHVWLSLGCGLTTFVAGMKMNFLQIFYIVKNRKDTVTT